MNLAFLREKGNKYIILGLLGLLLLVVLIPVGSDDDLKKNSQESVTATDLECRLEKLLSSMDGVGQTKVMITTEKSTGSLFGEEQKEGRVLGVVVVAEGAEDAVAETKIMKAVQALFSIEAHKISIIKMSLREDNR